MVEGLSWTVVVVSQQKHDDVTTHFTAGRIISGDWHDH